MTTNTIEQDDAFELEALIDAHSLGAVLKALALICYEKADHIQVNWQDQGTASVWSSEGRRIENLARQVKI